jgi:CheY-like chemotaxis protein
MTDRTESKIRERPLKVLVVDDDHAIRAMLRIAFSVEDGVGEVLEAQDGDQAVGLCEAFEPDVIFLDYWMPRMDGAQAAVLLRARHPSTHIIAFSGVLEQKPDWADQLVIKGDMPNLETIIGLARSAR